MEVQSLVSPIETAGHPYNSAALPRSLWQVMVIDFIWGQKVECQGHREFALFWVPLP